MLILGDCLTELKKLPENSIDCVVTDPPYELGFMGKSWDNTGIAYNPALWKEVLRVLKPGGHLLSFGGSRTYHRMACAIEDAGFEIRDQIMWVYGSGFPKSLAIGKAINKLETDEWSKIWKALDNIDKKSIIELWKNNSKIVKIVDRLSEKNETGIGIVIPASVSVPENVAVNPNHAKLNFVVPIAEVSFSAPQATNTKINTVLQNVEAEIKQSQDPAKFAEVSLQSQSRRSMSIFTAQCDVKEWLKENIEVNHKVDEVLKTLRGNKKYSNEEIINVLTVAQLLALKLTILNQSKTFQNLDTTQQMEYVSAINVIITEYTAECLISNTVDILKSKAVDKLQGNEREVVGQSRNGSNSLMGGLSGTITTTIQNITKGTSEWEGWGTALKPAHEPICMARKPLAEKTVAENCLKWGVGGLAIDECRVEIPENDKDNYNFNNNGLSRMKRPEGDKLGQFDGGWKIDKTPRKNSQGRFPANLIHDGSDEVVELFPDTKGGIAVRHNSGGNTFGGNNPKPPMKDIGYGDNGSAARFFYCAKASSKERNEGLEDFSNKESKKFDGGEFKSASTVATERKSKNHHPTVKPILLMKYLVKLISREGQTVLDPFMGSGTTGIACINTGRDFIGIEKESEYFEIAKSRIEKA